MNNQNKRNSIKVKCPKCQEDLFVPEIPIELNCPYCNGYLIIEKEKRDEAIKDNMEVHIAGKKLQQELKNLLPHSFCPFCQKIVAVKEIKDSFRKGIIKFFIVLTIAIQCGLLYFTARGVWGEILPEMVRGRVISTEIAFGVGAMVPFVITAIAGGALGFLFMGASKDFYKCSNCEATNDGGVWKK